MTLMMPPQHKYPHLKDVSSLYNLNTDLFLHQSFTVNLQLLQNCHLGLPVLGCLDSLLSLCPLDQKF